MSNRTLTRLAWLVLAGVLGCTALSLGFRAWNAVTPVPDGWGPRGFEILPAIIFAIVGTAILARYPRHLIGWLCSLVGLVNAVAYLAEEYAIAAVLRAPGSLPLGGELGGVHNWT